ncbi:MAG: MraY family glycosyltransferase, partial [Bdellovibrionia bacterium]
DLGAKPKFLLMMIPIIWWSWAHSGGPLIFEQVGMPTWLAIPLTVFWITAITNGVNLIDGMDGACAGTCFIVALMLSVFSAGTVLAEINIVIAVSILSFLFFNLPSAKIYLGNNGSYTLGFVLAAMSVIIKLPAGNPGAIAVPFMLLAFPQIDTLMAMARRLKRRQSLLQGDHEHIHHKLQNVGFSVIQSLIIIFFVNGYAAVASYSMWRITGVDNRIILLVTTLGLLNILFVVYFLERKMLEAMKSMVRLTVQAWLQRSRDFMFDVRDFSAIVVDLDKVYPHLQPLIPERWAAFALDVTDSLNENFGESHFADLGDDRIVVILGRRASLEAFGPFFLGYEQILKKYNIPGRPGQAMPLGLAYYSSSHRSDMFVQMLKARETALSA